MLAVRSILRVFLRKCVTNFRWGTVSSLLGVRHNEQEAPRQHHKGEHEEVKAFEGVGLQTSSTGVLYVPVDLVITDSVGYVLTQHGFPRH